MVILIFVHFGLQDLQVRALSIDAWLHIAAIKEITIQNTITIKDLFNFNAINFELLFEKGSEIIPVFIINETILEHSSIFMDPATYEVFGFLTVFGVALTDSLEDLGDIS